MNSISLPGAPRRGVHAGFGAQIAQAARLWRRVVDHRMRPFGLTEATWLPLLHLARAPAAMRQKELAASLVARQLVRRSPARRARSRGPHRTSRGRRRPPGEGDLSDPARPRHGGQGRARRAAGAWRRPHGTFRATRSRPRRMCSSMSAGRWRRWPTSPAHESPRHRASRPRATSRGRAVTSRCGCSPCSL